MFHDLYADFQCDTLDNGVSVYSKEWANVSWFYAGVVIHAGAREDPTGYEGLAHLVEHLVGENVEGLTFLQLKKRVEALGGYGCFGATSYLASKYSFHFPNERKGIHEAFSLFGKMLLPAHLVRHIEEEKAVIAREYHQIYEHTQSRSWALQGRPFLFAHHPRLQSFDRPIGTLDEWMASTQQELQAFYDTYYTPANISLVCLGPLARKTLVQMLSETAFSMHKPGRRNSIPAPFSPHLPHTQEQVIHVSEFFTLAREKAVCAFEWVIPLHFSRYCLLLLSDLLEDLLMEELRYKRSLTYEVEVGYHFYQDCRVLSLQFEIAPENRERAKDLVWHVLHAIPRSYASFLETQREHLNRIYRMDYSGYDLLQAALTDVAYYHRLISFSEELQDVEQVAFEHIVELSAYLTPERSFCFVLTP